MTVRMRTPHVSERLKPGMFRARRVDGSTVDLVFNPETRWDPPWSGPAWDGHLVLRSDLNCHTDPCLVCGVQSTCFTRNRDGTAAIICEDCFDRLGSEVVLALHFLLCSDVT